MNDTVAIMNDTVAILFDGGTALSSFKGGRETPLKRNATKILSNLSLKNNYYFSKNFGLSEQKEYLDYVDLWDQILLLKEEEIIIVTGTDNLPFLSNYLDLVNNQKRIIITCSQRSFCRPNTEIYCNLLNSLSLFNQKTSFFTWVVGSSLKENYSYLYSSNIFKLHSYEKKCFVDLNGNEKEFSRNETEKPIIDPLVDSGKYFNRYNIGTTFNIYLKTPFSSPLEDKPGAILLPGLGNPLSLTQKKLLCYTPFGPSLGTYAKNKQEVLSNWVRSIIICSLDSKYFSFNKLN
jgi:hypothetical protein